MEITIDLNPLCEKEIIKKDNKSKYTRDFKGKSLITFPSSYIVLDIETTGLDSRFDEIIEISAIKIENNIIVDEYSRLVKPKSRIILDDDYEESDYIIEDGNKVQYIDDFISSLTGITNKMLDNEQEIDYVLPSFKEFISDNVLIGHNVNFDINFLYDNFIEIQGSPLTNNFVDTLRIARKLLPELKHHRLDDLIAYFNIDKRDEHRALNDCKLTNNIFNNMKNVIIEKYGELELFEKDFKKKHTTSSVKAKDVKPTVDEIDTYNPLYNKVCVFTGTLEKLTRKEAMQLVVNLGGICGDNVTSKTNFLILGNNDYCQSIKDGKSNKQKKAESLKLKGEDVEIISENVFYDMIEFNN